MKNTRMAGAFTPLMHPEMPATFTELEGEDAWQTAFEIGAVTNLRMFSS